MNAVITGMGTVSCVGSGVEPLWRAAADGRSGLRPITRFTTEGCSANLGGEVPSPPPGDPRDWVFSFARDAFHQALESAGLRIDDPRRAGIALGTTLGCEGYAEAFLAGDLAAGGDPPRPSLYHSLAGLLADEAGLEGPCLTFDVACASSLHAVGYGMEAIRRGKADVMIVGGADYLSQFVFSGFHSLHALASEAVRPFDARRDGLAIGEGAGVIVLEREDSARRRGAPIRAVVRGWGFMEDAVHLTAPDRTGGGMSRTIQQALDDAKLWPSEIGYISAHGTGTRYNDENETTAAKRALGEDARRIPVSSTKPVIGHCMGAAGALETVIAVRALEEQVVPPTLNYEQPDPKCDLDYVPGAARPHPFQHFLKLAAGFGGQNGALVVSRHER